LSVKNKNKSFKNFSDWLKLESSHHISTKGISKILKQKDIMSGSKNSIHEQKNSISELNKKEHKPQIVLKESDGIVTGLEITCVCGETINIDFEYDKKSGISYLKNN